MQAKALIVDRIEGEIVVCEQAEQLLELPLAAICGPVQEGDLLTLGEDGLYQADGAATEQRRAELTARFQALIRRPE